MGMKRIKLFENFNNYKGKDLVIVDIQPEYEKGFDFETYEFTEFLNENHNLFNSITILYNGEWTLGMINEFDYKMWMWENGLEEGVEDNFEFYDKGYAFFRYCMDSNIEDGITINLIKYMIKMDINDTRDLDAEFWDGLIEEYKKMGVDMNDARELLEHSDDMIHIPDLMDELKYLRSGNILLTGGHIEECLREVVIALKSLDMDYEILEKFIY
jgi:hypothetical protein